MEKKNRQINEACPSVLKMKKSMREEVAHGFFKHARKQRSRFVPCFFLRYEPTGCQSKPTR